MRQPAPPPGAPCPVHAPAPHESGLRHTSGEAQYVDDLAVPGLLHGLVLASPHARARLTRREATAARALPGVHAVLFAQDIPGENQVGPVLHDEPLLAADEVSCVGQAVALVVAESPEACRAAAARVELDYQPHPDGPILTLPAAIAADSWLSDPHTIARGDVDAALAAAPLRLSGEVESGAQDHFYLETQVGLALPGEAGTVRVLSSTQHPTEVQQIVARVLGAGMHDVCVEVPRLGGGFGGKETQAAGFAALAALGARRTGRPVKVWLNRDQDMAQTGKRHPFLTRYDAGFDLEGRLLALRAALFANGGFSTDLSRAICDRALFHVDNGYFLPAVSVTGRVARTNLPSNTAFRGFGGPQGMLVVESVLDRAAARLGLDPAEIRRRNLYGDAPRDTTHYGQVVHDNRLPAMVESLLESSAYARRRAGVAAFNASARYVRRGLALGVVKFGISFTTSFLNQAGALVVLYTDGTAQLNHGGTEMGQGLQTKMLAVCAHELGLSVAAVRAMPTSTEKVPNTSATAASCGADLNGQAIRHACGQLRDRLRPVAARLLGAEAPSVVFRHGRAFAAGAPARTVTMAEVAEAAHRGQISLSATGYYRTPDIHYDRVTGRGRPFHYFAFGAVVSEVEVSGLTGEHRLVQVDILHDAGDALVPTIDLGQVEGGFVQGVGWLTSEEVVFDAQGRLLTHSPDTYKIPTSGDLPVDFHVRLLEGAPQRDVIHGSKAVGEPPLMLAISVVSALRDAVAAFGPGRVDVRLDPPCTPEAVLRAIDAVRAR